MAEEDTITELSPEAAEKMSTEEKARVAAELQGDADLGGQSENCSTCRHQIALQCQRGGTSHLKTVARTDHCSAWE